MKKNFKITGLPAVIILSILFFIQCLLVCGVMKLLTIILHIDFDLGLTITTFVVCKVFQIIGYFAGVRWE